MVKKNKRRRSSKRRPDFFRKNRFLLALMFLAGLAVVSLVMLARREEHPQLPVVPPITRPQVDYAPKLYAEVEAFLASINPDASLVTRNLNGIPARYTVVNEVPSAEMISDLRQRLATIPDRFTARLSASDSLIIEKSGQAKITIQFISPLPPVTESAPPAGPLLAIIMDDLGRSTYVAEVLTAIAQPVTFSILPGEPYAAEVAEIAYAGGREVMLHVPMEPQGYPAVNPGPDALFVKDSALEIRRRFERFLAKIPYVSGTNNHMGSRFTEDARALAPVMESLQGKALFFVDSRTTGSSKVSEVATRFAVPTMDRDVFLDNVAEVDAISRQIFKLESLARRQGTAIGICHPYPETLEALRKELPRLSARGVTVVPVSVLLQKKALQGS